MLPFEDSVPSDGNVVGSWGPGSRKLVSKGVQEIVLSRKELNPHCNGSSSIDSGDPMNDVFQQPQKSLLADAFGRPVGIGTLIALGVSIAAFLANHFMLGWDMLDDYALVAFFVAGGVLLSVLLRSGDTRPIRFKRNRGPDRITAQSEELLLDHEVGELSYPAAGPREDNGLAETSPSTAPVPTAATATDKALMVESEKDEEVDGYKKALVHYVDKGDLHGQGEILRRLGHVAKARGHLKESREFYFNARNCFKQIDDNYAEAAVLLDLGQVLESLGDHDAASAAYRDANRALLDVAMNSGDRDRAYQANAAD